MIASIKRSLRAKLILVSAIPLVGVVLFAALYFPVQQRQQSEAMAEEKVRLLSEMLAFSVGAGLGEGNYDLVGTANDWVRGDSSVLYVAIFDEAGSLLFEHNPDQIEVAAVPVEEAEVMSRPDGLLQASAPVTYKGEMLGRATLLYSLESLHATIRANTVMGSIVNVLLLVSGIGLMIVVLNLSMRQITSLRDAAEAVGNGNLGQQIDTRSDDEIGDLGQAFNKMVANIRRAQEALQAEKDAVEQRVREAVRESESKQRYLKAGVDTMLVQMERFADGDLSVQLEVARDDDMGRLYEGFNRATAKLRQMIRQVDKVATATAKTAMQIQAVTDTLAQSAQKQSAKAGEMAAAVEQMNATIANNAHGAVETASAAKRGRAAAQDGGEVIEQTVAKIRSIAHVVSESSSTIERLDASSSQIDSIVQVISRLAVQTNILSLNATIEAARAGEHGQSFSVVANEVRSLAGHTADATVQIDKIIHALQEEAREAVRGMQRGTVEVNEGIALADKAGNALRTIVTEVKRSESMIAKIAAAAEEQSMTSHEIAQRVDVISQGVRDSAVSVRQIAQSAESLKRLTDELDVLLEQFQTSAPHCKNRDCEDHGAQAYSSTAGDGLGKPDVEAPNVDLSIPHEPQTARL